MLPEQLLINYNMKNVFQDARSQVAALDRNHEIKRDYHVVLVTRGSFH